MDVTISDVARRAGVAKSTVSLVLNGRPGVSPETRAAVLRAAGELGYAPRRSTPEGAPLTRTLLVICQRYPGRQVQEIGLVYSAYIDGVRQVTNARTCDLVVLPISAEAVDRAQTPGELMLDAVRADGILIAGLRAPDDPLLRLIRQLRVPFLALGRHWPAADFGYVGIDDQEAMARAVEYLAGLGHREIAFLGEDLTHRFMWHQLRVAGWRQGLERSQLAHLSERVVIAGSPEEGVAQALARWPQTSALIGVHDHWAQGVVRALHGRGLGVPGDVSVVGHDNTCGLDPARASLPGAVPLTSIDPQQARAGRLGAEALLRCVEEAEIVHVQLTLRWHLAERASTGAAPGSSRPGRPPRRPRSSRGR